MTEYWALTLKYNPNDLTTDELSKVYDRYKDKLARTKGVEVISWVEEDVDKKGHRTKKHVHGTLAIKRGVYRKKLQVDNYHVKLVAITDITTWNCYTKKNVVVKMFKPIEYKEDIERTQSPAIPDVKYNMFWDKKVEEFLNI